MLNRPLTLTLLAGGLAIAVVWTHHEQSEDIRAHVEAVEGDQLSRDLELMAVALDAETERLTAMAQHSRPVHGTAPVLPAHVDTLWVISFGREGLPAVNHQEGDIAMAWSLPVQPGEELKGLWRSDAGEPLLVSVQPIESDTDSESPKSLVVALRLTQDWASKFGEQSGLDCEFWDLGGDRPLPPDPDRTLTTLSHESHTVQPDASGALVAYRAFGDMVGRPQLLLSVRNTQGLTALTATALRSSLYYSAGLGVIAWLLGALFLKLSGGNPPDEGDLEQDEDSRELGGILHNMGNVLNSLNISASVVSKKIDDLSLSDLDGIAQALEKHKDHLAEFVDRDTHGQHLRPLLTALADQLGNEQRGLAQEVQTLNDGIEHICEIMRCQQGRASLSDRAETVRLGGNLEEALRITNHGLNSSYDLEVVREFDEDDSIETDKHSLLEILVNLVQNARQSMALSSSHVKRLVLRVRHTSPERVLIEVEDTGQGITPESMSKVFDLGFTTNDDGHGYGLHTAAVAAREMGGVLWASSAGEGCGATFTLELPTSPSVAQIAGWEDAA